MIRFLQRQKAKKGFTIVELIMVIAIIGVLMAVILPQLTTKRSTITDANSAARDFYTAMQSVFSKYSLYEGPLSAAYQQAYQNKTALNEMHYFKAMGGNYPYRHREGTQPPEIPATTSLYFEFETESNEIKALYSYAIDASDTGYADGQGLFELCKRDSANLYTEFGKLLRSEIEGRINYRDGYYYAKVTYKSVLTNTIPAKMEAETVKVEYTGYSKKPLQSASDFTGFKNNNMYFGESNVLKNGNVFGVCAPYNPTTGKVIGQAGTTLS